MNDSDDPDMFSESMDVEDPERYPIQVETSACVVHVAEAACCFCRACPVAVLLKGAG